MGRCGAGCRDCGLSRGTPALDRGRLFLTGVSRGGRGVLRLAIQRLRAGRVVTAVAAFCPAGGAAEYSDADLVLLRQVPIYFFHCPEDESVPFEGTAMLHRRIGSASSRLRIVTRASWPTLRARTTAGPSSTATQNCTGGWKGRHPILQTGRTCRRGVEGGMAKHGAEDPRRSRTDDGDRAARDDG